MAGLKIGSVTLTHGVMLAPLAGVTDLTFRTICRGWGAEYTVSEMISAKALCFEQRGRASTPTKTADLARITGESAPTAIQLFGSEPDFMARAASLIESGEYRGAVDGPAPVAIDINMGCPMAKIVGNGEGCALMRDPARAAAIVRAVKNAVKLPVTVKFRAGWDGESRNAVEFAKEIEAAGADLITVHGRTRQQFYAPSSDPAIIAAVKAAVSIPVIANGDLFSAADVRRILKDTDCDGVMIARGALGNPFIFAEIIADLEKKPYTPPKIAERLAVAEAHATALVEAKGERIGIAEARKHLAWYTKGMRGAATARDALMRAETLDEVTHILKALIDKENL